MTNILKNILIDKSKEQVNELLTKQNLRIEQIISNGQSSPKNFWYDQEEHEFVVVLQGDAILEFEDREVTLNAGDCLNIKKHEKHRVKYTSLNTPTIWLAIFYQE